MKNLWIITIGILIFSCSQEDNKYSIILDKDFGYLSPNNLAIIDTMRSCRVNLDSIILPNGALLINFRNDFNSKWNINLLKRAGDPYLGISGNEIKNKILELCLTMGDFLVYDQNFVKPSEGINKPAQNGLAYCYGAEDYTIRSQSEPNKEGIFCPEFVYGLDCSAMIWHMFRRAQIQFDRPSAADIGVNNYIQNGYNKYGSTKDILKVKNYGKLDVSKFESGDIVYWTKIDGSVTGHVGMVLKSVNGTKYIYQSNGSNNECAKNYTDNRGPRTLALSGNYWFSYGEHGITEYQILRTEVLDNSGIPISSNDLQIGGCYPAGVPTHPTGPAGSPTYPAAKAILSAEACFGNPPYLYMMEGGGKCTLWTQSFIFEINEPGTYTVNVKDALGYYASKKFIFDNDLKLI